MPGYGKAVGFIANFLDKMQGSRTGWQAQFFPAIGENQYLQTGLTPWPFGHTKQRNSVKLQLLHYFPGAANLPFPAVDHYQIG